MPKNRRKIVSGTLFLFQPPGKESRQQCRNLCAFLGAIAGIVLALTWLRFKATRDKNINNGYRIIRTSSSILLLLLLLLGFAFYASFVVGLVHLGMNLYSSARESILHC